MKSKNRIAALVVTYNRLSLLVECIEAIRSQTFRDIDIIVVNNGSTDGTLEWLSKQKDIETITQDNQGGAGGFHTGIRYAVENGYQYTWLMDDDTIPNMNALEKLLDVIRLKPDFGFVCSRVVDIEGNPCNCPLVSFKKAENGESRWISDIEDGIIEVDYCTFVSVLFNNSYAVKLGLPYKDFFIWGDDTEYSCRFSDRYDCYLAINSIVIHKRKLNQALSIFNEKERKRISNYFYSYRNGLYLSRKRGYLRYGFRVCNSIIDIFKLIKVGEFNKAYIICKAILSSVFFCPKRNYPIV